ncbi:MAG: TonB-dependent receptor [Neisseriaceae bacterium]|nr:TonB-dependent receptor [Neisseriaceae bacterium]
MFPISIKPKPLALALLLVYWSMPQDSHAQTVDPEATLDNVVVVGKTNKDRQGANDVYDKDLSTLYINKTHIDRYKGSAPADVFKGLLGVQSGDARNSGALDPNIRGLQGQGRVPLTIDGTEQAITVWRGYNGANNRNYIDPSLIGSIQIEKGPSLTRGVKSSVGGAVVVKTLSVDDVLPAGETFGGDVLVEASNGSVKPRLPNLRTGEDARDIPGWNGVYGDPTLRVQPKSGTKFGQDEAIRVALATRQELFDVVAAYSYRSKGNHLAGKKGAAKYRYDGEGWPDYWDHKAYMANVYRPGMEVPNTSSRMASTLLKGTLRLPDNQSLELGLRHTDTRFGEIMPSRLKPERWEEEGGGVPQWPLSEISLSAYNLLYQWKPDDRPWVDLEANLWATRSVSDTYNGGGFPNEPIENGYAPPESNEGANMLLRNTAATNARENRWGVTVSNKATLLPNLDFTLSGSFQHERLRSDDDYDPNDFSFRASGRQGTRKEHNLSFNFDWEPASWLALSAGMNRTAYSAFDDFLDERTRAKDPRYRQTSKVEGYDLEYKRVQSLDEYSQWHQEKVANHKEEWAWVEDFGLPMPPEPEWNPDSRFEEANKETHKVFWAADADGKMRRDNNPFLNGSIQESETIELGQRVDVRHKVTSNDWAPVKKSKGHAWTPVLGATAFLTDNARVYVRYSEAKRMPSMFESTVGFSATAFDPLKPEHAKNFEVAYIHDLRDLVGAKRHADVKIAYYHNSIKNAIERDDNFVFSNIDRQKVAGLELQGRYDNGRFFTDLGVAINLKNEVCDEASAVKSDPYRGRVANCVRDGFRNGYLRNMPQPKYMVNWLVGGRFLNQRLELGSRVTFHSGSVNNDERNFGEVGKHSEYFNAPLEWSPVVVVDAHANYRVNPKLAVELGVTNLTDRYYLDPLSRARMPAPGRTVKLTLKGKF